jgi:hypothetical protein
MEIDWSCVKEVLVPVSTIITLATVAISSVVAVCAYRLNLKAEVRLKESAKAEIDAKLLALMTTLAQKANGRSGYEVSHDVIKKVLESEQIMGLDWLNPMTGKFVNQILENASILTFPVGSAEQNFAIRSIGELGLQHESLRRISTTTLGELSKIEQYKELCQQLTSAIESVKSSR